MIACYLQNSSPTLTELCNLTFIERCFYTASMLVIKDFKDRDKIEIAKISNPFLSIK